jgi:DNA invertase Pin-like site-specific DNA recombinase
MPGDESVELYWDSACCDTCDYQYSEALPDARRRIKRERITDSVSKRRAAGKDLGGIRERLTNSQIENARRLIAGGEPAIQVARDLGMSRATLYRRIAGIEAQHWVSAQG